MEFKIDRIGNSIELPCANAKETNDGHKVNINTLQELLDIVEAEGKIIVLPKWRGNAYEIIIYDGYIE